MLAAADAAAAAAAAAEVAPEPSAILAAPPSLAPIEPSSNTGSGEMNYIPKS